MFLVFPSFDAPLIVTIYYDLKFPKTEDPLGLFLFTHVLVSTFYNPHTLLFSYKYK